MRSSSVLTTGTPVVGYRGRPNPVLIIIKKSRYVMLICGLIGPMKPSSAGFCVMLFTPSKDKRRMQRPCQLISHSLTLLVVRIDLLKRIQGRFTDLRHLES